ncbi:hypothetical protein V1477_008245 [Vespula maculifrons]|uniref:Uncharacterized protein n=1 Tax=Vespula maculifrons TaxID=7453 RepID=A0ABD2CCG6_VESMC
MEPVLHSFSPPKMLVAMVRGAYGEARKKRRTTEEGTKKGEYNTNRSESCIGLEMQACTAYATQDGQSLSSKVRMNNSKADCKIVPVVHVVTHSKSLHGPRLRSRISWHEAQWLVNGDGSGVSGASGMVLVVLVLVVVVVVVMVVVVVVKLRGRH